MASCVPPAPPTSVPRRVQAVLRALLPTPADSFFTPHEQPSSDSSRSPACPVRPPPRANGEPPVSFAAGNETDEVSDRWTGRGGHADETWPAPPRRGARPLPTLPTGFAAVAHRARQSRHARSW
ncbi:hypothetical protein WOLCODRAFT_155143 [Wolfiporia cocos MD-104 SS10]|uniref:Uncharacterized protein n=1 Tax=Wolfiporia cocos (strain MD-104) TaxID=742152 RepID=A0A2H3K9Q9_WOLCO|nr:hypothetical protein WOLCODRAFT_155143 [Wolfiporia cocos MD-104 SS10]